MKLRTWTFCLCAGAFDSSSRWPRQRLVLHYFTSRSTTLINAVSFPSGRATFNKRHYGMQSNAYLRARRRNQWGSYCESKGIKSNRVTDVPCESEIRSNESGIRGPRIGCSCWHFVLFNSAKIRGLHFMENTQGSCSPDYWGREMKAVFPHHKVCLLR